MAAFCVEYAKSNRAQCKGCSTKIDKDAVRIGTIVKGPGDYDMTSWRHLACQKKKPGSLAELAGYAAIKPADQETIKAWLAGDMGTVLAEKRKADEATASAAAVSTPKKAKTAAAPSTPPTVSASSSAGGMGAAAGGMALGTETEARDAAAEVFVRMTIPDLKSCLRQNEQVLGGTKPELVERCVDRKLYGNLPRCPQCSIGKLKVAYPRAFGHGGQGVFTCPGGYDDDQYVRCSFRSGSVERKAWVVTTFETAAAAAPAKSGGGAKSGKAKAAPTSPAKSPAAKSAAATPVKVAMPSDDTDAPAAAPKSAPVKIAMPSDDD